MYVCGCVYVAYVCMCNMCTIYNSYIYICIYMYVCVYIYFIKTVVYETRKIALAEILYTYICIYYIIIYMETKIYIYINYCIRK